MSVRSRILDWLLKDEEKQAPPLVTQSGVVASGQTVLYSPRNMRQFAIAYEQNIVVYRAINIVAQACASLDWDVYLKGTGEKKKRVPIANHPLKKLFAKPNPEKSRSAFIEQLISYWMIAGTNYMYGTFPGAPAQYSQGITPNALYNLRPDLVQQICGDDGRPTIYRYQVIDPQGHNRFQDYSAWQVLPFRFFNPLDELSGLSVVQVAAAVVERQQAGEEWNFNLMKNMARPSGAFVSQSEFGDEARTRLKREIYQKYGRGKATAGMPMLLENGLSYIQLAINPTDADWINSDSSAGRKIASAIGVDPLLLNDKQYSTYNNELEAKLAMWEFTCFPLMERIKDELNGFLVPFYGDSIEADYDKEPIESLRRNRQLESVTTLAEWNTGVRSFNMTAADLDLEGVTDVDDFYRLGAMFFVRKNNFSQFLDAMENIWKGVAPMGPQSIPPLMPPPSPAAASSMGNPSSNKIPGTSLSRNPVPMIAQPGTLRENFYQITEIKNSKADLQAMYRAIEHQRSVYYSHFTQAMKTYFTGELATLIQALAHQKSLSAAKPLVMAALELHQQQLQPLFAGYYASIAEGAAHAISLQFQHKSTIFTKQGIDMLGHYAGTTIDDINDTTKQKILTVFTDMETEEKGVDDLAQSLRDVYQGYGEDRAALIAQNEAVTAYNAGSYTAASQLGMPLTKTWLTAGDSKVRDAHKDTEGQVVPFDQPFDVGGDQMQFPKDASLGADPSNIINCRCTIIFSQHLSEVSEFFSERWAKLQKV